MIKRMSRRLDQKFVEKVLRGLQADGRYPDGENLYLRVKDGYAAWIFIKTSNRAQREYSIGSVRKLAELSGSLSLGKRAGTSLSEARTRAADIRGNIARGKPAKAKFANTYPSLSDILEYYCKRKQIEEKATNSFVGPFAPIYHELGPKFTKSMGVSYRDHLIKEGKADNTVDNYMRLLKGMFTIYMVDHSVDIANPLEGVIFKKSEDAVNNRDPLSHEVIKNVYEVLEGEYKLLWLVLAVTGARLNEIYGLKSKDIRDGFVSIEPNERRRLKNKASKRTIPLFLSLPMRTREYYWDDLSSVSALSQYFQARIRRFIPKELDGKRVLTTHSLRHSLTDHLRFKGIQQNIEDMYLGHSAKDVSNRVYGSLEGRKAALRVNLEHVIEEYKEIIADVS